MTTSDISILIQGLLVPLGGWSVILVAFSVFLSKLFSERILQQERLKNDIKLSEFKNRMESLEKKSSLNYQQKIELYKVISEPLADLIALIDASGLTLEHLHEFNRQRLNITAKLALFASQEVFDSFNNLLDYIYDSLESNSYTFGEFREQALNLLSAMRKDIGIYQDSVTYKGSR